MSSVGAGYDHYVTTFSPTGRVFQVEYAAKAVEKSGTVLGISCKDGVVMGVEKFILSRMMVKTSNRRIQTIGTHSGLAVAGLVADARQLVNKGRKEVRDYLSFYGMTIPGRLLSERLAGEVHSNTLYWWLRPYGCSVLLAHYDKLGKPGLWLIQPSGVVHKYFASAIGKHKQAAKSELEKINFTEITCREAVKKIAAIIYKLHDDIKEKAFELEMTWICDESDRKHTRIPADLLAEAVTAAKDAKRLAEMDDSDSESEEEEKKH